MREVSSSLHRLLLIFHRQFFFNDNEKSLRFFFFLHRLKLKLLLIQVKILSVDDDVESCLELIFLLNLKVEIKKKLCKNLILEIQSSLSSFSSTLTIEKLKNTEKARRNDEKRQFYFFFRYISSCYIRPHTTRDEDDCRNKNC